MKKILAVLTVIVMLGCMLSVTAFADGGYVPSPCLLYTSPSPRD